VRQRLRPRLSYANVVSTICLFIVLGGSAYAASQLPKNSVGTKQLKNKAVTGAKVKDGSLTGTDVNASTLGTVPKATSATSAGSASKADDADKLGGAGAGAYVKGADAVGGSALGGTYAAPTLKASEALHFVGSGGEPTFDFCNSGNTKTWVNAGSTFGSAAYYRDPMGIVHLSGTVKCPTAAAQNGKIVFTLPAGFRPPKQYVFTVARGPESVGKIEVQEGGVLNFGALVSAPGVEETVNLNGIDFRCAPSGVAGCP
jgi:hypothetical protein